MTKHCCPAGLIVLCCMCMCVVYGRRANAVLIVMFSTPLMMTYRLMLVGLF